MYQLLIIKPISNTRHRGSWKDGPIRYRSTILSEGELPTVMSTTDLGKNVDESNKVINKDKKRDNDNPSLKQAMQRVDWPKWEKAIHEEYDQMFDDKVFQNVTNIEKGSNIIGSMFVLNIKRDKTTGAIDKYKARLVALGNKKKLVHIKTLVVKL